MIVLIFISILVWFELQGIFVLFAFVVIVLLAYASLKNTINVFKLHKDLVGVGTFKKEGNDKNAEAEEQESEREKPSPSTPIPKTKSERAWAISGNKPSEAVFLIQERKRITRPTEKFCYVMFGFEFLFFFLWPTITLVIISWNVAVLFVLVALVSALRHYVNAGVIIEETGDIELVGGDSPQERWRNKSRLNTIVVAITAGKTKKLWLSILGGKCRRLKKLRCVPPWMASHHRLIPVCIKWPGSPFWLFS
jgi:hypothetical protein